VFIDSHTPVNKKLSLLADDNNEPSARMSMKKERVAEILERDAESVIRSWMSKVERNEELSGVALSYQERTCHLPLLLRDVVCRLRLPRDGQPTISRAARDHGILRRGQGYTVPMVVEESRILQVSIFSTLQNNLSSVDFGTVLLDVVTIADEVDSQLKQAMLGFMESPPSTPAAG
jgi:hypothetical protein